MRHCCPACGKHVNVMAPMLLGRKSTKCGSCDAEIHIIVPIIFVGIISGALYAIVSQIIFVSVQAPMWIKCPIICLIFLVGFIPLYARYSKLVLTKPVAPSVSSLRRFHLLTAIAVVVLAGLLLYRNLEMQRYGVYGWPYEIFAQSPLSISGLVGNLLVGSFILFMCTVFCELAIWESTVWNVKTQEKAQQKNLNEDPEKSKSGARSRTTGQNDGL